MLGEVEDYVLRHGEPIRHWGAFGRTEIQHGDVAVVKRPGQPPEQWEFVEKIQYRSMKVGGIYGLSYNQFNTGYDVFIFDGFSDIKPKYGEGGPVFGNVNDVMHKYDCKSLAELENVDDKMGLEYGHGVYLCSTSLILPSCSGCFYYPFKGRWSSGSGAEALTFWEVRRI